jgi:hypothetical protein
MVQRLPADLEDRLAPLIAMGYDREKCEEAYRNSEGDIERAAERLAEGRTIETFQMGDPMALFAALARRRAERARAAERERERMEEERSQEGVFRRLKRTFEVNDEFLAEQLQAVGGDLGQLEALFR